MTDRQAQARAEAVREAAQYIERLHPKGLTPKRAVIADLEIAADRMGRGIHANGREREADADPKPHTITREELGDAADEFTEAGTTGEWVSIEDMLIEALSALGIEVEDDDE